MSKNKTIIVLSGKQFSGKDTVAKILLELLPNFKRIGIGDAIKIEYGKQKGLTFDEIEANKSEYRADLIALGNKGRAIDPFYWLNKIIEQDENVIVPDMRVKKELEIFKNNSALTIRVESSKENRSKRGILAEENDTTETELDSVTDWDFVVENNAGLEELTAQSQKIADKVNSLN